MNYQEALKELDKRIAKYRAEREKELKENPDDMFGDALSDIWLLDIYEAIANYAIKYNDQITVDGFLLSDIISKDLCNEDGYDVNEYELLEEFLLSYGGDYETIDRVNPKTAPESVARLINHFKNRMEDIHYGN